jgi:hypothetical protein
LEQTSVVRLQVVPPQHGCPVPPQGAHFPVVAQVKPLPQAVPLLQHG